jgi:hypothetical protein
LAVGLWIGILMVDTEEKWVTGFPDKAQGLYGFDNRWHRDSPIFRKPQSTSRKLVRGSDADSLSVSSRDSIRSVEQSFREVWQLMHRTAVY